MYHRLWWYLSCGLSGPSKPWDAAEPPRTAQGSSSASTNILTPGTQGTVVFCLRGGRDFKKWPYCPLPESTRLFLMNTNSAAPIRQSRSLWAGIFPLYVTLRAPNSACSQAPHAGLGINAAFYYCNRQISSCNSKKHLICSPSRSARSKSIQDQNGHNVAGAEEGSCSAEEGPEARRHLSPTRFMF